MALERLISGAFPQLWCPLDLRLAVSVCHRLPCQLCLSQRLIHFNCTLECSWERRRAGLFCTYYCIRTFAVWDEIVPCLKSVCLSACADLWPRCLFFQHPPPSKIQTRHPTVPVLFSAASACYTPRPSLINFHTLHADPNMLAPAHKYLPFIKLGEKTPFFKKTSIQCHLYLHFLFSCKF